MSCCSISREEYEKLIGRLSFYNSTRNTLLAFSFTAVLAAMGVVLGAKDTEISYWFCIIPYFLILPFSARIAYYRLAAAYINAFLMVFAPDRMALERGAKTVPEGSGTSYRIIAWLVNHEMFCLSVAVLVVFIQQFLAQTPDRSIWAFVPCLTPVGLTIAAFLISNSVYSYKNMSDEYEKQWKDYHKDCLQKSIKENK